MFLYLYAFLSHTLHYYCMSNVYVGVSSVIEVSSVYGVWARDGLYYIYVYCYCAATNI